MVAEGPFQPKNAEGATKPEAQWFSDERRVVNQDQCLKSIIISCFPDDIMESVISCKIAKDTWTDLVHSFKGPFDTKENMIIDLKLEYNTFRPKLGESLSQTYTQYKTLLNELFNDGVKLSKHEINVGFMNRFQENSDDERTIEEYLRDIDIEFHERALLASLPNMFKVVKMNQSFKKITRPSTKGFVAKTVEWDEEEVYTDEEMTQVKVLIALADNGLVVGKNHARNSKWIDITMRKAVNECHKLTKVTSELESSKESGSKPHTPLPPLKVLQRASPSSEVMPLTYQENSLRERPGLGTMKYTKPDTQESLSKSVSRPVTICTAEPITPLVPTKVKSNEQESKINELTKLIQMLMNEKVNSSKKD
nr:retrovirus-related Pol polyprotein from transposon TNT 1-94 [Tanacetum cinerariifolium]